MCGIAGIVKFNNPGMDIVSSVRKMNDALKHRGPDGEGYLAITENDACPLFGKDTLQEIMSAPILQKPLKPVEEYGGANAILAHRRLKIIDISPTGHQPMCNTEKNLWIVFNGEIYNYVELREELEKEGYSFHTSSDTEVILAAYLKWGYECVNRFNGMWAFTIYDKRKNVLFSSRDRFGVKPYYYIKNERFFAFASEQKALLASSLIGFKPNNGAIFDYLLFSVTENEEEGMFKGILELQPAHSLVLNIKTGEFKKWKYYTLPFAGEYDKDDYKAEETIVKIRSLISEAVKLRLRSDVEVGSCLSGGIDSSSIISLIYKSGHKALNTFTASFDDGAIDESPWAKIVADYTHANAHWVKPAAGELLKDLRDLIYCQDIPIWSTSTYAQYRVMQLIKQAGIKVALDGQGGDELFAGYENYFTYHLRDELLHNGAGAFIKETNAIGKQYPSRREYIKYIMLSRYLSKLSPAMQLKARLLKHTELSYLKKDFIYTYPDRLKLYPLTTGSLNNALHHDFNGLLLKSYLKCEDRCSMWHSVESRTPFSDDIHLIEYVFSVPSKYKIRQGTLKWLLRSAMKGITPPQILNRKDKKGYVTPNRKWIAEIKDDVRYLFENPAVKEYIDTKKLLGDYDKVFNRPAAPDNGRIFKLIAFPMWLEIFSGKYHPNS